MDTVQNGQQSNTQLGSLTLLRPSKQDTTSRPSAHSDERMTPALVSFDNGQNHQKNGTALVHARKNPNSDFRWTHNVSHLFNFSQCTDQNKARKTETKVRAKHQAHQRKQALETRHKPTRTSPSSPFQKKPLASMHSNSNQGLSGALRTGIDDARHRTIRQAQR